MIFSTQLPEPDCCRNHSHSDNSIIRESGILQRVFLKIHQTLHARFRTLDEEAPDEGHAVGRDYTRTCI